MTVEDEEPQTTLETSALADMAIATRPSALWLALCVGFVFAVCGALLAVSTLAVEALGHIFVLNDPSSLQEIAEGLPLPRRLDWSPVLLDTLEFVRDANPILTLLARTTVLLPVWLTAILALNPTFRLFHRRHGATFASALETTQLNKALDILLRVGLPALLIGYLLRFVPFLARDPSFLMLFRMIVLFLALFLGYHPDGMAGDFAHPGRQPLAGKPFGLIATAVLFGFLVGKAFLLLVPMSLHPTLTVYHTLGTFQPAFLREVASGFLGATACAWLATGAILVAVGRNDFSLRQRLPVLGVALVGIAGGGMLRQTLEPTLLAKRFDLTARAKHGIALAYDPTLPGTGLPTTKEATKELLARIGLPVPRALETPIAPKQLRTLALFTRRGMVIVQQLPHTDDHLPPTGETEQKLRGYLKQKQYRSALSLVALRNLMYAQMVQFDTTGAMDVCLLDLMQTPHFWYTGTALRDMISICAASPQNRVLLDRLGNTAEFISPDRSALRRMGDLYRRFGDTQKAVVWYERAEMPRSFLKARREEKPMFHTGRLAGTLSLDGKPLAHVRVGVWPRRLNGLTHDLEARLLDAIGELLPHYSYTDYVRSAFSYRWISAATTTDAQGRFTLEHLTEGEYELICALSPQDRPAKYAEENRSSQKRAPAVRRQLPDSGDRPGQRRVPNAKGAVTMALSLPAAQKTLVEARRRQAQIGRTATLTTWFSHTLLLLLAAFAVDVLWPLPAAVRGLLLAVPFVWLARNRRTLRRVPETSHAAQATLAEVARAIERQNPHLDNALIHAVQFGEETGLTLDETTAALMSHELERAEREVARLTPDAFVDTSRLIRERRLALLLVMGLLLSAIFVPRFYRFELPRFFAFWTDSPPFTLTDFEVSPKNLRVKAGSDLTITVRVRGALPQRLEFCSWQAGEAEQSVALTSEDGETYLIALEKLNRETWFFVRGDTGRSGRYRIQVDAPDKQDTPPSTLPAASATAADSAPKVRFVFPAQHVTAKPDMTLTLDAEAEDETGLQQFEGHFRVNDGPEIVKKFPLVGTPRTANHRERLNLKALGAKPGDRIEYFATANDTDNTGTHRAESERYRIEVVSEEKYRQTVAKRTGKGEDAKAGKQGDKKTGQQEAGAVQNPDVSEGGRPIPYSLLAAPNGKSGRTNKKSAPSGDGSAPSFSEGGSEVVPSSKSAPPPRASDSESSRTALEYRRLVRDYFRSFPNSSSKR